MSRLNRCPPRGSATPLKRLLALVAGLWPRAVLSAALRVVSQGSGMVLAALAGFIVGAAAGGVEVPAPEAIWAPFLGIAAIKGLCRYAEQVSGHGLAFSLLARMRSQAFRKLETLAPAYPEEEVSGEVVSQLTADVDRVEVFYAHTLGPAIAYGLLSPGAVVGVSLLAGPFLGLSAALGLAAVGLLSPWLAYRANRQAGTRAREYSAAIHGKIQENLRGAEDLRAMDARRLRQDELDALARRQHQEENAIARNHGIKDLSIEAVIILTLGVAALIGVREGVELAHHAAALGLIAAAFSPALGLGRAFDDLPETLASARRFFALMDREPAVRFVPATSRWIPPSAPEVRVEGLGYRRGTQSVLDGLDMSFPPGSHTCIVGPSGSGKTTLVRLLARFYDPSEGRILVSGRDLRSLTEAELRATVSYLGQDAFLFTDTVEENLRCIAASRTGEDLEAALDRAGLFPGTRDRLRRSVGIRGQSLSGGERKRLALARILLQDAPVVLLDESFSNLDHRTRHNVRRDVLQALRGRTVIECTHEPEDRASADQVMILGQLSVSTG